MKSGFSKSLVLLLVTTQCWLCCQCRRGGGDQAVIPGLLSLGDGHPNIKFEAAVAFPESSVKAAANRIASMVYLAKMDAACRKSREEVVQLTETSNSLVGEISNDGKGVIDGSLASELRNALTRRVQSCSAAYDAGIPADHAAALDLYFGRWQFSSKESETENQKFASEISDPSTVKDLGQSDLHVARRWLWEEMFRACLGGYGRAWLTQHSKGSGVQFNGVVEGNLVGPRQAAFEYRLREPHLLFSIMGDGVVCQVVSPQEQSELTLSIKGAVVANAQLDAIVGAALAAKQAAGLEGDLAPLAASIQQRMDQVAKAARSLRTLDASVDSFRACIAQAKEAQGEANSAARDLERLKIDLRRMEDDLKDLRSQRDQISNAK